MDKLLFPGRGNNLGLFGLSELVSERGIICLSAPYRHTHPYLLFFLYYMLFFTSLTWALVPMRVKELTMKSLSSGERIVDGTLSSN